MRMGAVWIAAMVGVGVGGACGGDAPGTAQRAAANGPTASELLGAVVATCADASGAIEVRRRDASYWEPAARGATLRDGDWIRAPQGGSARLRLRAGGHVDLGGKSALLISAGADAGTLAAHAQGTAVAVAETPPATEPEPEPEPPQEPAEVALAATTPTETPTETHGDTGVARRPAPSRPARPARPRQPRPKPARLRYPDSVSPRADARLPCKPSVDLVWQGVPDATGYRISIGKDLTFKEIVKFIELKGGKKSFFAYKPIATGTYAWRVAARGKDGRYGEYGFARRFHCTP